MRTTDDSGRNGLETLPAAYADWRSSTLGRVTDALEQDLILDLIGPPAGRRILDVGCGDGILAVELASRRAIVTGIDASPDMIAAARRRASREKQHIDFVVAEAGALPFDAESFDAVVAVAVLCFVEHPGTSLRDMGRVLRPGGRLVIGELGKWSSWAAKRRIKAWLGSPLWRRARFRTASELCRLAQATGFVDASVTGAIYYPPVGLAARLLGPMDYKVARLTTLGAAFLALSATRPKPQKSELNLKPRHIELPPILAHKDFNSESAFTPESLLREARRQKGAAADPVPKICLLDPDGDIVRLLKATGRATRHDGWVCYHTDLYVFEEQGLQFGVVGCAVGASFAVLVAEELFASGCEFLISVTSSGQIFPAQPPPYFVMIERALRDEGTSYHYLPPSDWSTAPEHLLSRLDGVFDEGPRVLRGATWTTDAPFRETETAIAEARSRGILAVEMEAAGLYAFAKARGRAVICLAHVTNQMGTIEGDFEKGEANGTADALAVVSKIMTRLG